MAACMTDGLWWVFCLVVFVMFRSIRLGENSDHNKGITH